MHIDVLTFETLDSTNSELMKMARKGAGEGLCIVASHQTHGRGRHGRSWSSERDAGLYLSLLLRPELEIRHLTLITLMAGVAVHAALEEIGLKPDIKWVNDVLVDEKKICGILAETAETPGGLAVVVGVGINIRSSAFPAEIAGTATSLEDIFGARLDMLPSRDKLLQTLTKYLAHFYDVLRSENGPQEIRDEWRQRSTYFTGKSVRVVLENETIFGTTDGLEDNGALRIRRADGIMTAVQAGDVQRLREDT